MTYETIQCVPMRACANKQFYEYPLNISLVNFNFCDQPMRCIEKKHNKTQNRQNSLFFCEE